MIDMADQDEKIENPFADDTAEEAPAAAEAAVAEAPAQQEPAGDDAVAEEQAATDETAAEEAPAKKSNPNQRWYVVHAYSGFETYVKKGRRFSKKSQSRDRRLCRAENCRTSRVVSVGFHYQGDSVQWPP